MGHVGIKRKKKSDQKPAKALGISSAGHTTCSLNKLLDKDSILKPSPFSTYQSWKWLRRQLTQWSPTLSSIKISFQEQKCCCHPHDNYCDFITWLLRKINNDQSTTNSLTPLQNAIGILSQGHLQMRYLIQIKFLGNTEYTSITSKCE